VAGKACEAMTDIALLLIIAAALDLAALAVVIADVRWLRRPRPRVGTYIPLKLERGPD
jgi:hypothetical protein